MLTIFSCPKPFRGHINIIQRNAIKSWTLLQPRPEIILIGDEEGTAEICKEFGLLHIANVERNEYGTPLVNSLFSIAKAIASNAVLSYINADIILMSDFVKAINLLTTRHSLDRFLLVGRRWGIDIREKIDFSQSNWEEKLRQRIAKEAKLHGPSGIDYFVFPKGLFNKIPPFALGRTLWDNWLLYQAWVSGIPLIDATEVITIAHQNHKVHTPKGYKENVWEGPEAKENRRLAGGIAHAFTIRDCSKVLTKDGLKNPKVNLYRVFSFPFRYYDKTTILKPFLFPGWLIFLLWRKIKILK